MPPEPPLPAVVLARAVVADVEAQAAEPVAVVPVDLVQLRSPQFLVQPLLLELPLVLVAARLRLAEVALLAAVDVAAVEAVDGFGGGGAAAAPVDSGPQVSSMEIINLLLAAGVSPNSELNARRPEAGSGGRFAIRSSVRARRRCCAPWSVTNRMSRGCCWTRVRIRTSTVWGFHHGCMLPVLLWGS